MKIIFLFLIVLSLKRIFVSALNNQSLTNLRRIGGRQYHALQYPPYVIELRIYQFIARRFKHQCMGTLLSQTWSLSAQHCFPKYIQLKDFVIFHGSIHWDEALPYAVKAIHRHQTDDIALANHARINIQSRFFPKLTTIFCPTDVRAVFHSFGRDADNEIPAMLLYSSVDVNDDPCYDQEGVKLQDKHICFTNVDLTFSRNGDSGSGMITGYGPGPIFSDKHDVKIIGVLNGDLLLARGDSASDTVEEVIFGRRVSEYIPWIQGFVKNVQIVDEIWS